MNHDLNVPATATHDFVILRSSEWRIIRLHLNGLLDNSTQAALAACEIANRRREDALQHLDTRGPVPHINLTINVPEDATDAELLVAARQALAAPTPDLTALRDAIIGDLYASIIGELDPTPHPIASYISDTAAGVLATSIIGADNALPPCVECGDTAEHHPNTTTDAFCDDCCPECQPADDKGL